MWKWFKSKVAIVTLDKFRIKVITLKDGTKKYFPQYKYDDLSSEWLNIIPTAIEGFITVDLCHNELISTNHYQLSEDVSKSIIESYKKELSISRAKQFLSEEIIKID